MLGNVIREKKTEIKDLEKTQLVVEGSLRVLQSQ